MLDSRWERFSRPRRFESRARKCRARTARPRARATAAPDSRSRRRRLQRSPLSVPGSTRSRRIDATPELERVPRGSQESDGNARCAKPDARRDELPRHRGSLAGARPGNGALCADRVKGGSAVEPAWSAVDRPRRKRSATDQRRRNTQQSIDAARVCAHGQKILAIWRSFLLKPMFRRLSRGSDSLSSRAQYPTCC